MMKGCYHTISIYSFLRSDRVEIGGVEPLASEGLFPVRSLVKVDADCTYYNLWFFFSLFVVPSVNLVSHKQTRIYADDSLGVRI